MIDPGSSFLRLNFGCTRRRGSIRGRCLRLPLPPTHIQKHHVITAIARFDATEALHRFVRSLKS